MLLAGFQDVQAHGVLRGVVKNQAEKIELQDGVEALGEFVEEGFEVVLLGNGFADFQQSFELPVGKSRAAEEAALSGTGFCASAMKTRIAPGLAGVTTKGMGCGAAGAVCVYSRLNRRACVGEREGDFGVRKPWGKIGVARHGW